MTVQKNNAYLLIEMLITLAITSYLCVQIFFIMNRLQYAGKQYHAVLTNMECEQFWHSMECLYSNVIDEHTRWHLWQQVIAEKALDCTSTRIDKNNLL